MAKTPSAALPPQATARLSSEKGSANGRAASHISAARIENPDAELDGVAGQFEASDPLDNAEKITGAHAAAAKKQPAGLKKTLKAILWFLQDQWFLLALVPLVILASQVQVPASGQEAKETAVTYASVSVIFFITGCTLPTKVLIENYSRWKMHLFVQVQW